MTKAELKQRIHQAIDKRAEEIVGLGETIRRNPELGFKEVKTARLVEETMGRLGLSPKGGLALTGVRADVAGRGGDGPTFALLGELDALVVTGHPVADPADRRRARLRPQRAGGRAARRGHGPARRQGLRPPGRPRGVLRGARRGVRRRRVARGPGPGRAAGVPRRQARAAAARSLRRRRPVDDDPHDVAAGGRQDRRARLQQRLHRARPIRYIGRASHAGGAPHQGINALYAAQIALAAHQRAPRDVPRRGHDPRAPDHHPRRLAGERDPGRGAAGDLRARADRGGDPRRQQEGRPRAPGRRAGAGRQGRDRDAARATCR